MSLADYGLTPEEAATIAVAGRVLESLLVAKMTPDEQGAFNEAKARLDDAQVKRVHTMATAMLAAVIEVVLGLDGPR